MATEACIDLPPDAPSLGTSVADYILENHIGFLLRRAHQRHAAVFNDALGSLDITPTQFAAMMKTVQLGRVTQNHLGRLTAMDPATIQGVVRRLTERGYIVRATDPLDRRSAVLAPTPEAVAMIESILGAVKDVANRILAPLEPAERAELARLLAKLS